MAKSRPKANPALFRTRSFSSFLFAWSFLLLIGLLLNTQTICGQSDGSLNNNFAPVITARSATVNALAVQPDGKVIVAGDFIKINGENRIYLSRLNPDGSLDASFDIGTGFNERINSVVLQPDGKILLGGNFTAVNNITRGGFARLNANGTLDTAFVPNFSNGTVSQIVLQANGKLLVRGVQFSSTSSAGTAVIKRFNADGSLDSSFNYVVDAGSFPQIITIAAQPDGKVLVSLQTFEDNGTANRVNRLNLDGSIDSTFNLAPEINFPIVRIAVQPNNQIVLGGSYGSRDGTTVQAAARINANGSLDVFFNVPEQSPYVSVSELKILSDGKILLAATLFQNQAYAYRLFRFNADATIDQTFQAPALNSEILTIGETANQEIYIGGGFVNFGNSQQASLARLAANGAAVAAFAPVFENLGGVTKTAVQPDGKILASGNFARVNGVGKTQLVRFNADGTLDQSFTADAGVTIAPGKILVQPDGKIIVAAPNVFVLGQTTVYKILRLNANGSRDTSFNPPFLPNSNITDVALQSDNKILVTGSLYFTSSFDQRSIVRLNANGSLETDFNLNGSGANNTTTAIKVQNDGKIYIVGNFTTFNDSPIIGIARLLPNGQLDSSFTSPLTQEDESFRNIFIQNDGKVLAVSRGFATNGITRLNQNGAIDDTFSSSLPFYSVADVVVQPDGKILIAGATGIICLNCQLPDLGNVLRLNPDGTIDYSFTMGKLDVNTNTSTISFGGTGRRGISSLSLLPDGKVVVGGLYLKYNETIRYSLSLLNNSIRVRRTFFDFDGDRRSDISVFRPSSGIWYVRQSADEQTRFAQFGQSNDVIAPADFDGDGKTDYAVFRQSTGIWYSLNSSNNALASFQFGQAGDLPRPADFDGDGKADYTVFRQSTGTWYRTNSSSNQFVSVQFGQNGDAPLNADFDFDGKADIAVFRPSSGTWYRTNSSSNQFVSVQFGQNGDQPVPADYDGDGITDIAVFRASNGVWYRYNPANGGSFNFQFGQNGDVPAPADYDGDGKADFAVFRNGTWYLNGSTNGFAAISFGLPDDKVVPAAFVR